MTSKITRTLNCLRQTATQIKAIWTETETPQQAQRFVGRVDNSKRAEDMAALEEQYDMDKFLEIRNRRLARQQAAS